MVYPSLISLMVSVDVKLHVYLLHRMVYPSLISLMVSVEVKLHVYLLHRMVYPSLISLMVSVEVKLHVYLLHWMPWTSRSRFVFFCQWFKRCFLQSSGHNARCENATDHHDIVA